MSTFIELVKSLHHESGAGGVVPQTVEGQTGESRRLVRWIQEADLEVQSLWNNWKFHWDQHEFTTSPGVKSYSAPDDLGEWDYSTFVLDDAPLEAVEHALVRKEVRPSGSSKPFRAVIMPNNSLRLDQTPDSGYTVSAEYYRAPTPVVGNSGKSVIPERFHSVILAKAMSYYANYEEAPEIKQQAQEMWNTWLPLLEASQLPQNQHRANSNDNHITIVAE